MIYEKRGRWCVEAGGRLRKFPTRELAQAHYDKYVSQEESIDFLKVTIDPQDFDLLDFEEEELVNEKEEGLQT